MSRGWSFTIRAVGSPVITQGSLSTRQFRERTLNSSASTATTRASERPVEVAFAKTVVIISLKAVRKVNHPYSHLFEPQLHSDATYLLPCLHSNNQRRRRRTLGALGRRTEEPSLTTWMSLTTLLSLKTMMITTNNIITRLLVKGTSRPVKPGAQAPRVEKGSTASRKANCSTMGDQTGQGAVHQRGATGHAREARRRPK